MCGGVADAVDVDGQDAHGSCRNSQLRQLHPADLQLHAPFGRQALQALVVVDEDEGAAILLPVGPSQLGVVALGDVLRGGELCLHRGQQLAVVLQEQVELAEGVVVGTALSELTEGGLEVVVLYRHIVVVGGHGALHLVEPRLPLGIGASVVHIVSQKVRPASQLHEGHRIGILRVEVGPAVVGCHHAATQFAGEVGILLVGLARLFPLLAQLLGGDGRRPAERLEVECFVVVAGRLCEAPLPEAVGIVAVEGQHLAVGNGLRQFGPSGAGVEGQVEADAEGHPLQGHQVVARASVLIIELGRYHRAAVFPLQALHLGEDLTVEPLHIRQEHRVLGARLAALGENPVGYAAVARLAVTEGADAQHHWQPLGTARLDELP